MIIVGIVFAVLLSQCSAPPDRFDDADWGDDHPTTLGTDVPSWPPIGGDRPIAVHVADADGLERVRVSFRRTLSFGALSDEVTLSAWPEDLGEGLGPLTIEVTDERGAVTTEVIDPVLIDLTPPDLYVVDTLLAVADPEATELLEVRMVDTWVLGRLDLDVGADRQSLVLPEGWPDTTGVEVDATWVDFSVDELDPGEHEALLTATDAAGNVRELPLTLVLDGSFPTATFVSPAPGEQVWGWLDVDLDVTDDLDGAPVTSLFLDGTLLGAFTGTRVEAQVDTSLFLPGTYELTAVSEDEAGNVAEPVTVVVTIAP